MRIKASLLLSDTHCSDSLKCVWGRSTNSICIKNGDGSWQQSLLEICKHLIFKDRRGRPLLSLINDHRHLQMDGLSPSVLHIANIPVKLHMHEDFSIAEMVLLHVMTPL